MRKNGNTSKDELILRALITYPTIREAARNCGCSESTIYRRLKDAEFRTRLQEMKSEIIMRSTDEYAEIWDYLRALRGEAYYLIHLYTLALQDPAKINDATVAELSRALYSVIRAFTPKELPPLQEGVLGAMFQRMIDGDPDIPEGLRITRRRDVANGGN